MIEGEEQLLKEMSTFENQRNLLCTNAHSTNAKSAKFRTLVVCKTALRRWSRKTLLSSAMAKYYVRSTETNLQTGSACSAARWPYSLVLKAKDSTALLAMMLGQKITAKFFPNALVVQIALQELLHTQKLLGIGLPVFHQVAAFADQKNLNKFQIIMMQMLV